MLSPMARRDDLRRVEHALTRISRISSGRASARYRAERSGVRLSRPALSILGALDRSGAVRLSELARLTDLEPPLISRAVRELTDSGYIGRSADPTDGRASIVQLTETGRQAIETYMATVEEIVAEVFSSWSAAELHALASNLERVAHDLSIRPGHTNSGRHTTGVVGSEWDEAGRGGRHGRHRPAPT
jgi:DNA-binding MarR family transcriptional regulator